MQQPEIIDARLFEILECPRDGSELHVESGQLCCHLGHTYPVVSGIPVFLLEEKTQTIGVAAASIRAANSEIGDPLFLETLGVTKEERLSVYQKWSADAKIDAVISHLVAATSGFGYVNMIGRLESYPIPNIPIRESNGELLLDIGSNWGRWSVSAARKGWRVIGIDPSLGALMAAKRAFSELGLDISFVCGDARFLPFKADAFKNAFSYSVIQHFSEPDTEIVIMEMERVLCKGGVAKIQMAHKWGLRSMYIRTRRNYIDSGIFRVRYWSLTSMRDLFLKKLGPTSLKPEAFGGLGLLPEDKNLVNNKAKLLISISEILKKISLIFPPLIYLADSVYVESKKAD